MTMSSFKSELVLRLWSYMCVCVWVTVWLDVYYVMLFWWSSDDVCWGSQANRYEKQKKKKYIRTLMNNVNFDEANAMVVGFLEELKILKLQCLSFFLSLFWLSLQWTMMKSTTTCQPKGKQTHFVSFFFFFSILISFSSCNLCLISFFFWRHLFIRLIFKYFYIWIFKTFYLSWSGDFVLFFFLFREREKNQLKTEPVNFKINFY